MSARAASADLSLSLATIGQDLGQLRQSGVPPEQIVERLRSIGLPASPLPRSPSDGLGDNTDPPLRFSANAAALFINIGRGRIASVSAERLLPEQADALPLRIVPATSPPGAHEVRATVSVSNDAWAIAAPSIQSDFPASFACCRSPAASPSPSSPCWDISAFISCEPDAAACRTRSVRLRGETRATIANCWISSTNRRTGPGNPTPPIAIPTSVKASERGCGWIRPTTSATASGTCRTRIFRNPSGREFRKTLERHQEFSYRRPYRPRRCAAPPGAYRPSRIRPPRQAARLPRNRAGRYRTHRSGPLAQGQRGALP